MSYPEQAPTFAVTRIRPISKGGRKELAPGGLDTPDAATADQKAMLESQVSRPVVGMAASTMYVHFICLSGSIVQTTCNIF